VERGQTGTAEGAVVSTERERLVKRLLLELLELPPTEQKSLLERRCGDDVELRRELESLLARETAIDGVVESHMGDQPAVRAEAQPTEDGYGGRDRKRENKDFVGQMIGHIRVVEVLGRGGMGAVYKGFDDKLQRHVALKAIRSEYRLHADSKARFLREARILSKIDHPHVCRAHDYIEGEDCDFLVMELVEGRNLRRELEREPNPQQKMDIARQLMEVLATVHSEGVIHRDLKPDNVMVTPDGDIKVLDFGLARSVEEEAAVLSESAVDAAELDQGSSAVSSADGSSVYVKTKFGSVMGTLGYMSPEQAQGLPATAASDMYSLGLILQELFTGEAPFDRSLKRRPLLLKTMDGDTLPVHGLNDDLTALINRLKSVAPGARPSSVDALAELERIIEKPKRIRRRAMVIAVWLALVLLALGMTVQSFRAQREARRAEQEAEASRSAAEFLASMFEIMQPDRRGHETPGMEILDDGARRAVEELGDQPLLQARLMDTMGVVYRLLGLYDKALPLSEGALAIRREILGDEHLDVASSATNLAVLLSMRGEYDEAEALLREALAVQRRLLGDVHPDVVENLNNLTVMRYRQGDIDGAEPLLREAMMMTRRLHGEEHPDVAAAMNNLAFVLVAKGDLDGAESLIRESVELHRRYRGEGHTGFASSLNSLAWVLQKKGDNDAAEPLLREALSMQRRLFGDEHPELVVTINNLAMLLQEKGDLDAAEVMLREALAMRRKLLGEVHPKVATSLNNLAFLFVNKGDLDAAEPLLREALEMRRSIFDENHPDVAVSISNLAMVLQRMGDLDAAEPMLREVLEIRLRVLDAGHPDVGFSHTNLALVLAGMGDAEAAESMFLQGLDILEEALPPDHPELRDVRTTYAGFLRDQGRADEAAIIEAQDDQK
jgi:serine/threonine-protein kinase